MEHDVQSNKIEHNVNIKENAYNLIYIDNYNKQFQDVPIITCFNFERVVLKNNLNVFQINYQYNFLYTFKFK
jgi:hypothetical protein